MTLVTLEDIERVAVVGAGQMGRGIAAVAALAGYDTALYDVDADQLDIAMESIEWSYGKVVDGGDATESEAKSAVDRLDPTDSLEDAVSDADVVTEAVVERQAIKRDVFQSVDETAPAHAILTTNTSGLNITALAEATGRPSQITGTHWFRPPMLMDLVEVIETKYTSETTTNLCEGLVEDFGKTAIRCRRDVPLFIVNRCMRPYGEAAAWLVYYDQATIEEVDSAMKYREDFPMGPFELADYTGGIQIRVESEQDLLEDSRPLSYDTRYCPLLHDLYEKGHFGRKVDRGFYDYTERDAPEIDPSKGADFDVMKVWAPVINEAAKMVQHDVATIEDVDTGMRLGGNWPQGPFEKADEVGGEAVVRSCIEVTGTLDRIENIGEFLPCELLVEKAKAGDTFY